MVNMDLLPLVCFLAFAMHGTALGFALHGDDKFCDNLSIIGGQPVSIEQVPFMVALQESAEVVCAGTIVHEKFILTAASCIRSVNVGRRLIVGTDRISDGGFLMDVEKAICHEEYDSKTMDNDICLLKLFYSIPFGRTTRQIVLPRHEYKVGLFNVTGWGLSENTKFPVNELRQVTVPFVSADCCSKMYEGMQFSDNQICAGSHGHDACQGDSGGPLTYQGVQIGIASYGAGCGVKPGVYTKVANYVKWIGTTIDNNL